MKKLCKVLFESAILGVILIGVILGVQMFVNWISGSLIGIISVATIAGIAILRFVAKEC